MEATPHCERNSTGWLFALIAFAVMVLAYACWLAWQRGEISGFHASGEPVAVHDASVGPPVLTPAPATPSEPAATPAAMPVGGGLSTAIGSANPYSVDAITTATPGGGFYIVGGAASAFQQSFKQAADVIRPSVVKISVDAGAAAAVPPIGGNAANEVRFADPLEGAPDTVINQRPYKAVGSGLVVDTAGHVLTNHHVVRGFRNVVLTRFQRVEELIPATVVAIDAQHDLAMLQVTAPTNLTPATFADSATVEVGDWVLAIGNPFGFESTVTAGIVGARGVSLTIGGVSYEGLIQTQAPINRGSSGGPLVNLSGRVVGINTAIYAPTGVFSGAGFAIPSSTVTGFVRGALQQMASGGWQAAAMPPQGAWQPTAMAPLVATPPAQGLGVGVTDMTPDLAARFRYPYSGGVFVNTVLDGTFAERADVQRGDVIISLAGQPIANMNDVERIVWSIPGGRLPRQARAGRGGGQGFRAGHQALPIGGSVSPEPWFYLGEFRQA